VRISVCAVVLVSLASCGYVGPVQPPTLDIPQHVSDLRAAEFGDQIIAEFSIPPLTTEGLPLKSLDSAEIAVGVAPNPWNVNVWAKDVTLAVRATGPKGKTSDWSNLVTVPVRAALARPADLKAENVRDGIQLTWTGAPGEHFHIYRASGLETPALIDSTDQPRFLDAAVDFGAEYRYYVDGFAGEQQFSEMAQSEPLPRADIFPPSAPSGLTAEMGSGTIELSWERNTDPRFQGYNVYRSVNGGAFEKIASLIAAPAYSDRDVQSGKQYRYETSAVGTNGRESARSAPVEITAQ